MKNYPIPARVLDAALTHAAKKDVRYYLNGAYLHAAAGRVVATDGHALFCADVRPDPDATPDGFPDCIIPRDAIDAALKLLPKRTRAGATVHVSADDDGTFRLVLPDGAAVPFSPVVGKFPVYEWAVPRALSGAVALYNPDLLTRARDALRTVAQSSTLQADVHYNGKAPALVMIPAARAFCIVMPLVDAPNACGLPDWYTGTPTPADAADAADAA